MKSGTRAQVGKSEHVGEWLLLLWLLLLCSKLCVVFLEKLGGHRRLNWLLTLSSSSLLLLLLLLLLFST